MSSPNGSFPPAYRTTPGGVRGGFADPGVRGLRWLIAIGFLLVSGALSAVQMVPLSLDELSAHADLVLYGKVLRKTCLRDDTGRICSKVEFEVRETWKGAVPPGRFTITMGGGTLGATRVAIPGQAEYLPGEEAVVFLRLNQRGEGVTLGLAQGKFEVRIDPRTGERSLQSLFLGGPGDPSRTVRPQAAGAGTGQLLFREVKRRVQGEGL